MKTDILKTLKTEESSVPKYNKINMKEIFIRSILMKIFLKVFLLIALIKKIFPHG
jgi:hypothetical protein